MVSMILSQIVVEGKVVEIMCDVIYICFVYHAGILTFCCDISISVAMHVFSKCHFCKIMLHGFCMAINLRQCWEQGRISLLGGPRLKYVRGPFHYDKQTVDHKNNIA